jgi:hypothetical protein
MSLIVEVSESGTLQLPAEILQAIGSNTRFVVEVESDRDSVTKQYRLILSPVPPEQPFWATATPENGLNGFTSGYKATRVELICQTKPCGGRISTINDNLSVGYQCFAKK